MKIAINQKYTNKSLASVNYATHKRNNKVVAITTPLNCRVAQAPTIDDDDDVQAPTMADMFSNGAHIAISRKIVKSIASKFEVLADGTIKAHRSAQACQDIVNSGFTQAIFEDITQAVAETLINWYANNSIFGVVKILNKRFEFSTYTNKNGEEKSYYLKLYNVVNSVLYDYSNKSQANNGVVQNYDVLYVSADGDNQTSASHINPRYLQFCAYDGAINEVLTRRDFNDFLDYISKNKVYKYEEVKTDDNQVIMQKTNTQLVTKTTIKSFIQVLYGCIDGLKLETIASRYNLGIATVKRRKADIKDSYISWLQNGGKIDVYNKSYNAITSCAFYGTSGAKATNGGYYDGALTLAHITSYQPTIGAFEFHHDDNEDNEKQYNKDSFVECLRKNGVYEVYYSHYEDIDGKTEKIRDYIHSVPIK